MCIEESRHSRYFLIIIILIYLTNGVKSDQLKFKIKKDSNLKTSRGYQSGIGEITTRSLGKEHPQESAMSLITKREFQHLPPQERQDFFDDLVLEIAQMISEDINYASETIQKRGAIFSDQEADSFFQEVAVMTLTKIEPSIKQLNELVDDRQTTAEIVSNKIAELASQTGIKKLVEKDGKVETTVVHSGAAEIANMAKEFIYMALQNV